jgi:site-specific DNA recombinase
MMLGMAPHHDPAAPVIAGGYGRQSKDKKTSKEQQLGAYEARCMAEGWQSYATYQDGVSASRFSTKQRKGWPKLLEDLQARRLNVLWLWESSRGDRVLSSWALLLETCRDLDVKIFVESHDRMYDMKRGRDWKVLAEDGVASAGESELTSDRVKRDTRARAMAGRTHSFTPYGWIKKAILDEDGQVEGYKEVLHPQQADVIRQVAEDLLDGRSLRSIVMQLNADGIRTARGNSWSSGQVRQMMLRDRNAGIRIHQGKAFSDGDWEPIYDKDRGKAAEYHTRIVTLLKDPERTTEKGSAFQHLLTALAKCGRDECGGLMRSVGVYPKEDNEDKAYRPSPPGYQCRDCLKVRRKMADVDEVVERAMIARLSKPDLIDALANGDPDRVKELREKIAALEAKRLSFADLAMLDPAEGGIDADQLKRMNAQLHPQIEAAKAELARCHPKPGLLKLAGPDAATRWAAAPIDLKRDVINVLAEVTIMPVGSGTRFHPSQIKIRWRRRGEPVPTKKRTYRPPA